MLGALPDQEMTCSASALLERRGRSLLNNAPALNVPKKSASRDGAEVSSGSTTASSASASPLASPGTSPKTIPSRNGQEDTRSLRLRRNGFRGPSINCELVLQDQQSAPHTFPQCLRLQEAYDRFEKLGEGSCAVVYKVRSRAENQDVAIKVIRLDDEERLQIAQKEYELLQHVNHPNIIRALDFFTFSMGAVLVLEYFEGRKLAKAVRATPRQYLDEVSACRLSAQLFEAVSHLHSCGVIHRDIKADNILVSNDLLDLRLVDFNAAKRLEESQALTMTGTVDYMPPEVLQGESPSQSGDVWAAGLCLYLMFAGRLPSERRGLRIKFDTLDEVPLYQGSLVRLEGDNWDTISEVGKQVVRDCLKVHCDVRPAASDILSMPWFTAKPTAAEGECNAMSE